MITLLLILALLFGVFPMIYARIRRELDRTVNAGTAGDYCSDSSTDDDFFGFDTSEVEEAAVRQPEYFTYETPGVKTAPVQTPVTTVAEEQPAPVQFDLRQAVIYQTLLNNRYINLDN